MSLAIIHQAFRNGEIYKYRRSIVWDIFGSKCSPPRLLGYDLTYGDKDGGFLYLDEEDFISGFGIQSPSDDAMRDLYDVARQVRSAIHLDDAFFVADEAFLADIPDWLPPLLRKPVRVAHDADELIRLIWQG
jgi:hypothetical protein